MPKYVEETRDKDLSEEEARTILRSALEPPGDRLSQEYRDAFRWVPWILAYTGARVNEATQLRKKTREIEGIWAFQITPKPAGSRPKPSATFPFTAISSRWGSSLCQEHKAGPLFYSTSRTRGGKGSKAPYKKSASAWPRASATLACPTRASNRITAGATAL